MKNESEKTLKYLITSAPLNFSQKIDEGASSEVFKFKLNKKDAAVKRFKKTFTRKKMVSVAEQLRKLKNPNVVKFYGFTIQPSAIYLEYCSVLIHGEQFHNISQLIEFYNDEDEFNFQHRLDLIIQATSGLSHLHGIEIVHRNMKPSNLLVTRSNGKICVKVCDFDAVLVLKETITTTFTITTNPTAGITLAYTAPEICNGSVNAILKASDIYALGISAFQVMDSGPSPWTGVLAVMNDTLLINKICEGKRPLLSRIKEIYKANVTELTNFCSLLSNMWNHDIRKRPNISEVSIKSIIYRVTHKTLHGIQNNTT